MPQLNQTFVRSISLDSGVAQKIFMDDELTGFALRVSPGKKVFYLQSRVGTRVLKRKIGEYGPLTVDQARKKALQMKAQLQSGIDPYAELNKGASNATLRELFDEYTKDIQHKPITRTGIEQARKRFGPVSGMAFKSKPDGRAAEAGPIVPVELPSWMNRRFRDISQDEVLARFDVLSRMLPARKLGAKPKPIVRTANQSFKYLQAAYNYAIRKHGLSKSGFSNPVDILKTARRWARINRRVSFLDTSKPYFVTWWRACEAFEPNVLGDYFLFTLLQAGRSIECATLKWDDVDFRQELVVFRDTKNGLDYTFPIAPLAMAILKRRHQEKVNDYVFGYKPSKKGHVVCPPQHAIRKIRAACGEHWAMHDLRRTFTTTMTRLNVHAFTIAHLMKHSPTIEMTLSYAPPTTEQLLEAMVRLENYLIERITGVAPKIAGQGGAPR